MSCKMLVVEKANQAARFLAVKRNQIRGLLFFTKNASLSMLVTCAGMKRCGNLFPFALF